MVGTRTATPRRERTNGNGSVHPVYELRMCGLGGGDIELAIWQLPTPATPRLHEPERTAALKGRALRMVESKVLRRLKGTGIKLKPLQKGKTDAQPLDEDLALNLALLFRTLAPMRSIDRIRMVAEGVDRMTREEAGYWLGMAVHRKRPRRVLAALRILLTTP